MSSPNRRRIRAHDCRRGTIGSLAAAPIGQRIGRLPAFIGGTAIILLCVSPLYLVLGPTTYVSYYLIGACASAFIAPFQLGALAGQKDASAAASLMPAVQAAGMMAVLRVG